MKKQTRANKEKEEPKGLVDIALKSAGNLSLAYGDGTLTKDEYSAPVKLFQALRTLRKSEDLDHLASACFVRLVKEDEYDEAKKCAEYMEQETLERLAYEALSEAVRQRVKNPKGGGYFPEKVKSISQFYLEIHEQNSQGEK